MLFMGSFKKYNNSLGGRGICHLVTNHLENSFGELGGVEMIQVKGSPVISKND